MQLQGLVLNSVFWLSYCSMFHTHGYISYSTLLLRLFLALPCPGFSFIQTLLPLMRLITLILHQLDELQTQRPRAPSFIPCLFHSISHEHSSLFSSPLSLSLDNLTRHPDKRNKEISQRNEASFGTSAS